MEQVGVVAELRRYPVSFGIYAGAADSGGIVRVGDPVFLDA